MYYICNTFDHDFASVQGYEANEVCVRGQDAPLPLAALASHKLISVTRPLSTPAGRLHLNAIILAVIIEYQKVKAFVIDPAAFVEVALEGGFGY